MNEESMIFGLGVFGFFGIGSLIIYILGKTIFKDEIKEPEKNDW